MKDVLGRLGWFAAGALALYYLDPQLGAQRRALLKDLVAGGFAQGAERAQARNQQRRRRQAYHRVPQADARSDSLLREQIQQRLGRLVSHPRAIDVQVENGQVRLSGDVLTQERDGLLLQVQQMAGVQKLVNAMTAHDSPAELATLESRQEAALAG
jgi:osmotically-inducible protein OsmY